MSSCFADSSPLIEGRNSFSKERSENEGIQNPGRFCRKLMYPRNAHDNDIIFIVTKADFNVTIF